MMGCFYVRKHPFSFCPIPLSLLNAHCVVYWSFTHGGPLSFIRCCLILRARPLSPFEKERGDKNIIKLPGDGAVWVSYLYCFIECMAGVVFMLGRGIYTLGYMVEYTQSSFIAVNEGLILNFFGLLLSKHSVIEIFPLIEAEA